MASMDDVTNKVKEALKEKPDLSIDEAVEITKESARQLPGLQAKVEGMQATRGAVLESSTQIERVYDEILVVTGNQKMVASKRFMEKAKFIRSLMETFDPNHEEISLEFLDKMEKIVTIRNLFAHVPFSLFSTDLEFDSAERYHGFYKGDLSLKDVKKSVSIFMGTAQEILTKTVVFINRVHEEAKKQQFYAEIYKILQEIGMADDSEENNNGTENK